jgi:hypothetical protein
MLETLKRKDFAKYLNQSFYIQTGLPEPVALDLIEANKLGSKKKKGEKGRRPFSVIFRGPSEPILPQSIYQITHEKLGKLDLFLVPVGQDKQGMQYEALFA